MEGLKNAFQLINRDSRSVVHDGELDFCFTDQLGTKPNLSVNTSSCRHCLHCVNDQVQDDLLQVNRIGTHRKSTLPMIASYDNITGFRFRLNDACYVGN